MSALLVKSLQRLNRVSLNLRCVLRKHLVYLKSVFSAKPLLPKALPPDVSLTAHEVFLLVQDPWYHDFTVLGYPTPQLPGIFRSNQQAKQAPLFKLIDRALDLCRAQHTTIKGVELFCADGFYSNYAVSQGAAEMYGVDTDSDNLSKACVISKALGHASQVRFDKCDVFKCKGVFAFGICAGGLYHIARPQDLLTQLARQVTTALVIQTVYSVTMTDAQYFEAPAPGWTWGCRFSYAYLLHMVQEAGWNVIEASVNELGGNTRVEDRGSAYLLCTHA